MTRDQIVELANEAAQAAFDGHAPGPMPSAATAYDFIRYLRYDDPDCPLDLDLWISPGDWPLFKASYRIRLDSLTEAESLRARLVDAVVLSNVHIERRNP